MRIFVLDQRRRAGIGELEHRRLALDLRRDVEQIARVEADIERIGLVFDFEFFVGAAGIRDWSPTATAVPPVIDSLTARPRSLDTVETRSTAASNSFLSTTSSLSLPAG